MSAIVLSYSCIVFLPFRILTTDMCLVLLRHFRCSQAKVEAEDALHASAVADAKVEGTYMYGVDPFPQQIVHSVVIPETHSNILLMMVNVTVGYFETQVEVRMRSRGI